MSGGKSRRAGASNLIPFNRRSAENMTLINAKAIEARRAKAALRRDMSLQVLAERILSAKAIDADGKVITKDGKELTVKETMLWSVAQRAMNGELECVKLLLAMGGEPVYESIIREQAARYSEVAEAVEVKDEPKTLPHVRSFLDYRKTQGGWAFLYGTTRSGKTYGIVQWLLAQLASGQVKGSVLIAGQTMPFLRNGAASYIRQLAKDYEGLEVLREGTEVRKGEAKILVQSFEKPERALSAQWDIVYLNEGNTLEREVVDQLKARTAGLTIVDFNPSTAEWWGSDIMSEANSLFCSFKDNPYLAQGQLDYLEEVRQRGEASPLGSYERWFYEVYYLGQTSTMGGGVFLKVFDYSAHDWAEETKELVACWGIDFGDTIDPNALVHVALDVERKRLHVYCQLYRTAVDDKTLADIMTAKGVDRLIFETATGGNTRVMNVKAMGFKGKVYPAEKEEVSSSVFNLVQYEVCCYDKDSMSEFNGYRIDCGRFRGADHCIDATRYVAHLLLTNKIR